MKFSPGDKVRIVRRGRYAQAASRLREGSGIVVEILLADLEYPLQTIMTYYQPETTEQEKNIERWRSVKVPRIVVQRDEGGYLIMPVRGNEDTSSDFPLMKV